MRNLFVCFLLLALAGVSCAVDDPLGSPGTIGYSDPSSPAIPVSNEEAIDNAEVVPVAEVSPVATGEADAAVALTASLVPVGDCDSLLSHLRAEATERVGAYGFGGSDPTDRDDGLGSDNYYGAGTFLQEVGINEGDIIATDNDRSYIVSGDGLTIVDMRSAPPAVTSRVSIEAGYNPRMFIDGDDILLIAQPFDAFNGGADHSPGDPDSVDNHRWSRTTLIQHITTSGSPAVTETLQVDGAFVSARAVGGVARVVLRTEPQLPFEYPPRESETDPTELEAANRRIAEQAGLETWLPSYTHWSSSGTITAEGQLTACDRIHAPSQFAGFGVLSVLTVPVDGALDLVTSTAVLARTDTVEFSDTSLYVATADQNADSESDGVTSIHRFDISSREATAYEASGAVAGTILSQSAMSEEDGSLRVATTTIDAWGDRTGGVVRILQQLDDTLVQVGAVGNIGNDEPVQSVRFDGTIGYVDTSHQDPSIILDLSDPTDPLVVGELEIYGTSRFLHPIGDDLVIAVGSHAPLEGEISAPMVSLFDVADQTSPQELAVWTEPNDWDTVVWDQEGSRYWAPLKLAILPVRFYSDREDWAGAIALKLTRDGITELARIDHGHPEVELGEPNLPMDSIARSMVYGTQLYTLSYNWRTPSGTQTGRLQGNRLDDFNQSSTIDTNDTESSN